MKICFVLEHFYPHVGGVEIIFSEIIKRLVSNGHEIRIATSDSGGVVGQNIFHGASVYYFRCISFFGHPVLPKKEIAKHIKWADIVHTTTYTAAPTAYALSKKYHKPCIITVHEAIGKKWFSVEANPFKAISFWLFEWFVVTKKYSAWHVISRATESDLLRYSVPNKHIYNIYPGIDETIWNPAVAKTDINAHFNINTTDKVFLYTGRPGKPKGLFVLLQAIEKVHPTIDQTYKFGFILSNDPLSERKKFENLVLEKGLSNRIKITNSVPYAKLPGLRKSAYAVIIPSLTEGFGFSATETAALGTPVIASTAGSLPEVLGGKVLLFENNNSSALANEIIKATQGKFDYKDKKTYPWGNTISGLQKLYKQYVQI